MNKKYIEEYLNESTASRLRRMDLLQNAIETYLKNMPNNSKRNKVFSTREVFSEESPSNTKEWIKLL